VTNPFPFVARFFVSAWRGLVRFVREPSRTWGASGAILFGAAAGCGADVGWSAVPVAVLFGGILGAALGEQSESR
jgi:hypothetical protein